MVAATAATALAAAATALVMAGSDSGSNSTFGGAGARGGDSCDEGVGSAPQILRRELRRSPTCCERSQSRNELNFKLGLTSRPLSPSLLPSPFLFLLRQPTIGQRERESDQTDRLFQPTICPITFRRCVPPSVSDNPL
eukprot:4082818-Pleurochrysis_carterae.AAC.2